MNDLPDRERTLLITGSVGAGKAETLAALFADSSLGRWQDGDPLRLDAGGRCWVVRCAPGKVLVSSARKALLAQADAVLLVLDVRRQAIAAGTVAVAELRDHLAAVAPQGLPVALLYTHAADPEALTAEELARRYNQAGRPGFTVPADALRALLAQAPAAGPRPVFSACARCGTQIELPPGAATVVCGACGAALAVAGGRTRLATAAAAGGEALVPRYAPPEPSTSAYRRAGLVEASTNTRPLPLPPGVEIMAVLDDAPVGLRVRARLAGIGPARMLVATPAVAAVPGYAATLHRRVAASGAIRHPNLLPLLRFITAENALVSADAPDHEPLSTLLARRRVLAPHHCLVLARQLALALEAAAQHGFAHGWLRPDSVLVSPAGQVLLDDLCLAKPIPLLLDAPGGSIGHWLAPECARGAEPDLHSDMFGLGALMFRMVAGVAPLAGPSARIAAQRLLRDGAPSAARTGLELSAEFAAFLERLLDPDPERRPADWAAVVAEIDSFAAPAQGPQFTAAVPRPISLRRPAVRPVQRRRHDLAAGMAVGAAVVLLTVVVAVLALYRPDSRPAPVAAAPAPAPAPAPPAPAAA
ncbi:MAG: protein kinase, partial [Planctomycetes bacterium]|nr:protein kinase [Planctomycetota bacterium]